MTANNRDGVTTRRVLASAGRRLVWAAPAAAALLLASGIGFVVNQNERAFVRVFGTVHGDHARPLQPGFHFKLPLVATADTIAVSLRTLHVPDFKVLTVDNQQVGLGINVNYTIADADVYHLMYEVGVAGAGGIDEQLIPVVRDRAARVMAGQNMVSVNANREAVQAEIEKRVAEAAAALFRIQTHSLQIASITPSDSFMASIDRATQAKNEAIAAENTLRTKRAEAEQVVAAAKGQAEAAVESASGEAAAMRARADAQLYATEKQADADRYRAEQDGIGERTKQAAILAAFGGVPNYVAYLNAQAALRFPTHVPATVLAGSGNATPVWLVPPAAGR